jgi:hypothetical protein
LKYLLFSSLALGTYSLSALFRELAALDAIGFWLFAALNLPGTFLHELMHYLVALATGGDPENFTIIPSGNSLGSVYARPSPWNAAMIGFAPLLLLPITVSFIVAAANAKTFKGLVLYVYLGACSWIAAMPSSQDLVFAMMHPISFIPAALILIPTILISGRIAMRFLDSR